MFIKQKTDRFWVWKRTNHIVNVKIIDLVKITTEFFNGHMTSVIFQQPPWRRGHERCRVHTKNVEINLARKEFELLSLLASKPSKVFLRNEILNQIWGTEVIVGDRTIDVHIRKIRQKLNLDCIKTVKGVGYKFEL